MITLTLLLCLIWCSTAFVIPHPIRSCKPIAVAHRAVSSVPPRICYRTAPATGLCMGMLDRTGGKIRIRSGGESSTESRVTVRSSRNGVRRRPNLRQLEGVQAQYQAEVDDYDYEDDLGEYIDSIESREAPVGVRDEMETSRIRIVDPNGARMEEQMMRSSGTGKIVIIAWGVITALVYAGNKYGEYQRKLADVDDVKWEHIVTEEKHKKELHAYRCENCGYTLFPARGRHSVFFEDIEEFYCPECNAPKDYFVDIRDLSDTKKLKADRAVLEAENAKMDALKAEQERLRIAEEGTYVEGEEEDDLYGEYKDIAPEPPLRKKWAPTAIIMSSAKRGKNDDKTMKIYKKPTGPPGPMKVRPTQGGSGSPAAPTVTDSPPQPPINTGGSIGSNQIESRSEDDTIDSDDLLQ